MPTRVEVVSRTKPHADIVRKFKVQRVMKPYDGWEGKWPDKGREKARRMRVYVRERKR